MVVVGLGYDFLFKSFLEHCEYFHCSSKGIFGHPKLIEIPMLHNTKVFENVKLHYIVSSNS